MSATPQWNPDTSPVTAWTAKEGDKIGGTITELGAPASAYSDTPFPAASDELGEEIPPDPPRRGPSVSPAASTGAIPGQLSFDDVQASGDQSPF